MKKISAFYLMSSLLAVLLGGLLSGCAKKEAAAQPPVVSVVKVARRNLVVTLEIASEFEPFQEIEVYAKVSGYIQKLNVDWGTHVKDGQILAVLEIPELQQQIQQDEASVHRSESDLLRAQEELNRANSAYSVAHVTSTRLAGVQKTQPGLISQEDIDVAQGKDLEANAGVSAAKDSIAASEQELAASKSALAKDQTLFAYSNIVAPFDGVVTRLYTYKGALLPGGTSSNIGLQALCRLSQNNVLRLVIPVPERAVSDIHLGENVAVSESGSGKTFTGKIVRFSDQIDMDTRTMHTEVQVDNPNYELVPGMYVSVKIPLHTVSNVLSVPIQTILVSSEGKGTVTVVNGQNQIERREVTTGLESATYAEILSGLNEGEMVVFGQASQFQPGQVVAPQVVTPPSME